MIAFIEISALILALLTDNGLDRSDLRKTVRSGLVQRSKRPGLLQRKFDNGLFRSFRKGLVRVFSH